MEKIDLNQLSFSELKKKLKKHCIDIGMTIQEYVESLLKKHLPK